MCQHQPFTKLRTPSPTTLFLARGTGAPENFRQALEQLKGYREIYAK